MPSVTPFPARERSAPVPEYVTGALFGTSPRARTAEKACFDPSTSGRAGANVMTLQAAMERAGRIATAFNTEPANDTRDEEQLQQQAADLYQPKIAGIETADEPFHRGAAAHGDGALSCRGSSAPTRSCSDCF
jgi:hypothetical protein